MQFILDEEQEMLKAMARDFLAKECPKTQVRKMVDDEIGYSPALWKQMAELGWLGLVFPEKYGGANMNFRNLAVVSEEMGRALAAVPFLSTVMLFGFPILNAASEEVKKEFLPKIAQGNITGTMAILEEDGDFWAEGIMTKAVKKGNAYNLKGTKLFVIDAKAADYIIVAAKTRNTHNAEDNITLFIVDTKEWGVYINPLKSMDPIRKIYEVSLTNVSVPESHIVGEVNKGWAIIRDTIVKTNALLCAEMIGGADWVMGTTVNYAKERIAFGVPIGSYQGLKHQMADMYTMLEHARPLMIKAVELIKDHSPDAPKAVSMAKVLVTDAYEFITERAIQIHGGNGFAWEHDIHFYFKRARWSASAFGNNTYHRELVMQYLDQ